MRNDNPQMIVHKRKARRRARPPVFLNRMGPGGSPDLHPFQGPHRRRPLPLHRASEHDEPKHMTRHGVEPLLGGCLGGCRVDPFDPRAPIEPFGRARGCRGDPRWGRFRRHPRQAGRPAGGRLRRHSPDVEETARWVAEIGANEVIDSENPLIEEQIYEIVSRDPSGFFARGLTALNGILEDGPHLEIADHQELRCHGLPRLLSRALPEFSVPGCSRSLHRKPRCLSAKSRRPRCQNGCGHAVHHSAFVPFQTALAQPVVICPAHILSKAADSLTPGRFGYIIPSNFEDSLR